MLYVYKYNFVGYVAFLPNFVVIVDQKTVVIHDVFFKLFQISYKSEHDKEQGEYNYPATITPGYQAQRKLDPLKDVSVLLEFYS